MNVLDILSERFRLGWSNSLTQSVTASNTFQHRQIWELRMCLLHIIKQVLSFFYSTWPSFPHLFNFLRSMACPQNILVKHWYISSTTTIYSTLASENDESKIVLLSIICLGTHLQDSGIQTLSENISVKWRNKH